VAGAETNLSLVRPNPQDRVEILATHNLKTELPDYERQVVTYLNDVMYGYGLVKLDKGTIELVKHSYIVAIVKDPS